MKNLLVVSILFIAFSAFKLNSEYKPGDKVENFTLLNSVDNHSISLSDYQNKKGVVIVFTSHSCPYSKIYEERIFSLAKEFEDKGIAFLLVNPNSPSLSADDAVSNMTLWANKSGSTLPYLVDHNQKLADKFAATRTPEVFVLKNMNGNQILFYKGAIDDNPQVPSASKQFFLKDALNSLLSNKVVKITEKRAVGCMIKKP